MAVFMLSPPKILVDCFHRFDEFVLDLIDRCGPISFHWRLCFYSRSAPIRGLVILRQTFVRRCQNYVTHTTTPVLSSDGPAGLGADPGPQRVAGFFYCFRRRSNKQCEQFNHANSDNQHCEGYGIVVQPMWLLLHRAKSVALALAATTQRQILPMSARGQPPTPARRAL
jgi:hypothetical protein